ncbi:GNAT family N-acetyltransferase [soil metagenome]
MNEVKFFPQDKGAFVLEENDERIAEMVVGISGKDLTVYHTEVVERLERQGIGSGMIAAMADFARKKELKIIPLCPFVKKHFKKNSDKYTDLIKDTQDTTSS